MKHLLLVTLLIFCQLTIGQKKVAITIDDVPNTIKFEEDNYKSVLLNKLDSLNIPIAIFVNEGLIYKTDSVTKNFKLLDNWVKKPYITTGNHSFSHSRYSEVKIDSFKTDILKGEAITRELLKKHNKSLTYFRFPYNDMGKDSIQHQQVRDFLKQLNYTLTPFTIESSDWMYNAVYEHYLKLKDYKKAQQIGEDYVAKTLEYFAFFETLAKEDYNRNINQIYLCHDNALNAEYLPKLINQLSKQEYSFISLDEALTDSIYQQSDNYYKKWGISWLYRWKTTQKERFLKMKQEPSTKDILELYESITKK